MAQVKLEEEQELWEPAEVKQGVPVFEDNCSILHFKKEEPEEVEIKAEPEEFSLIPVSIKSEEEEPASSLLHQTVKEETREDADGAGSDKHPESEEHGESSSDTDNSADWTPSAERPTPQTHSEGNRAECAEECCSSDSEFNPPTKTAARGKRRLEDYPNWIPAADGSEAGPKRSTCSHCGKGFGAITKLRAHEQTHTAEKQYKCPVCLKGFTQQPDLKRHMRTHTGEKPFKCSVCEKCFIQNNI
uniref:C2H2-type domain-containing protein n=1 Tax=Neogobius melanostomus TaxID=47308 RepID=A0A8C6S6B6_9GOBI